MHRFWDTVTRPLAEALAAEVVVEVGIDRGHGTRLLAGLARERGVTAHAIDPEPPAAILALADETPTLHVHAGLSLDVLPRLGPVDLALLDGDHNWHTVTGEVEALRRAAADAGRPEPVLVCHDAGWPYGRRDLYYAPERIPAHARHPWRTAGIDPAEDGLLEVGGLNAWMCNAEHSGGPRNGVLTALEDTCAEDAELLILPVLFGLAVVVPAARAKAAAPVLAHLRSDAGWRALAGVGERSRCSTQAELQAERHARHRAASRPNARIDAVRGRSFRSALPPAAIARLQAGTVASTYRGLRFPKSPLDLVSYQELIGELRPATVLDVGGGEKGSARWFADQLAAQGVAGGVVHVDHDSSDLKSTLTALLPLPGPWLVSQDGAHTFAVTLAVLRFADAHAAPGDVVVVGGGVLADLPEPIETGWEDGPNRAVAAFLEEAGDRWEIDAALCDRYGHNATWAPNGWLRRTGFARPVARREQKHPTGQEEHPMTQLTGVATVWLPVSDMQRAISFYSGPLGLSVDQQQDEWSELSADGLKIGLNARSSESPAGDGGAVLAFTASGDLEAAVSELSEAGVEFTDPISEHPWGRIATFKDPDGNALQLYAPPS